MSSSSSPQTPLPRNKADGKKAQPISVRACDACRRRKTRCSNKTEDGLETCDWCRKAGKPCTYEPVKRGPPTTYVESLESRMEAMEELFRSLSASSGVDLVAALAEHEDGDRTSRTEAFEKVAAALHRSDTSQSSAHAAPSFPSPRSEVPVPANEQEPNEKIDKLRYFGRSSGPYFAQGLAEAFAPSGLQMDVSNSLVEDLLVASVRDRQQACELPPPDLTRLLIDTFFDRFNQTYRLLHRPSFERALSAGMMESNPSFRSLVLMLLAIGAIWVHDDRLDSSGFPEYAHGCRGFKFYAASLGRSTPSSVIIPSTLFDLQASVLGVIWLLGATSPMATWSASGQALRKAIDVGAHREARTRWTSSVLEDQLRKRAFWILYCLDRHVSVGLGRPVAMSDDDTDLAYPADVDDASLDEWNLRGMKSPSPPPANSDVAIIEWTARLESIHGAIIKRLYSNVRLTGVAFMESVKELDSALNAWLSSLPQHLRWDPESTSETMHCSASLFANYYYAQILVHRELLVPARSHLLPFPSLAICCNAARSCAHVLDVVRARGRIIDTFFWAPLISASSAMILVCVLLAQGPAGATITQSAISDIRKCYQVVLELRSTSTMANRVVEVFARLVGRVDRAPEMAALRLGEQLGMDAAATSMRPLPSESNGASTPPTDNGFRLPFSTEDLSLRTFNGDATFSPLQPTTAVANVGESSLLGAASDCTSLLDTGSGLWDAYQGFDWPQGAQEIALEAAAIDLGWWERMNT